jgi:DNA repair protein RadC
MADYIATYTPITQWAEDDRPREKLLLKGKATLSDAELLAILLGSGTVSVSAVDLAKQILGAANNNLHELAKLSLKDLMKFKGIGEAKAITIISALELGRRRKDSEPKKREKIIVSSDVYDLMRPYLWDAPREEFWVVLLNRANEVIRTEKMSEGGVAGTVVDPKLIFKTALDHLASALILVHNHPSGNLKPSQADLQLTKQLKEAGKFLEINVLDHIIFTDNGFYSFIDEGIF